MLFFAVLNVKMIIRPIYNSLSLPRLFFRKITFHSNFRSSEHMFRHLRVHFGPLLHTFPIIGLGSNHFYSTLHSRNTITEPFRLQKIWLARLNNIPKSIFSIKLSAICSFSAPLVIILASNKLFSIGFRLSSLPTASVKITDTTRSISNTSVSQNKRL